MSDLKPRVGEIWSDPDEPDARVQIELVDDGWVFFRGFGDEPVRSHRIDTFRKFGQLVYSADSGSQALQDVIAIAHFGGLVGLSESEAIVRIRRLTLPHVRNDCRISERVAEAIQRSSLVKADP